MANLSEIFGEYQADQHDMFESLPSWYVENYDIFRGRLREVNLNATTAFFLSSARNKMYMMWWWTPSSTEPIRVAFEIAAKAEELGNIQTKLKQWLKTEGHTKTIQEGKEQKFTIFVDTIEEVISLFKTFMS